MARGYVKSGCVLSYTAGSTISSGGIVAIGALVGVALGAIASGETGEVQVEGVWDLPKATGAIAVGDSVDFDVSAGNLAKIATPAAGDVTGCGVAVAAAASADATVRVRLSPDSGTVT